MNFFSVNRDSKSVTRYVTVTALFIIFAVFFLSHPYTGIRHDGILYAGDALARIKPGQFHDDLYFLFGSQGKYTILPSIYAFLIEHAGLGLGTKLGMFSSLVAYLVATLYVIRGFAPDRAWFYCCSSVVLGWSIYGGLRVFAYSEVFLTSRSFAEPAVLFSLGLAYRRHVVAAIIAMLLAIVIHPLVAATGFIMLWILLSLDDKRWFWFAGVALVFFVTLGLLHVGPFSDIFARYDPEWLALVQEANNHAFITKWNKLDFGMVLYDAIGLYFVIFRVRNSRLSKVALAAIMAGMGAMLTSYLFVDIGQSVFLGKLQIWRTLWIMHWLTMATLPLVIMALWKSEDNGRVAALFLIVGWLAPFSIAPAIVAILALAIDKFRTRLPVTRALTRFLLLATILCAAILVAQYEMRIFKLRDILDRPIEEIVGQVFAINTLLFVMAALFLRFANRIPRLAVLIGVFVFIVSMLVWDQRSVWARTLESYPLNEQIWTGLVESNAKVYWYRDLMAPWVLLGHGNYYTQQQSSGAIFSRDMVMELNRRRKLTAILDFQEQICRMMNGLNEKQDSCEPTVDSLSEVCVDAKIDYIVLQSTLETRKPLASYSTGIIDNGYEKKFFLYRCSALILAGS